MFHAAKHQKSENIEQYVIAQYCEYDNEEEHIRDKVIATCDSSKLRKKCLTEPILKLEKLVEISQLEESATRDEDLSDTVNRLDIRNSRGRGNHQGRGNYQGRRKLRVRATCPRRTLALCSRRRHFVGRSIRAFGFMGRYVEIVGHSVRFDRETIRWTQKRRLIGRVLGRQSSHRFGISRQNHQVVEHVG